MRFEQLSTAVTPALSLLRSGLRRRPRQLSFTLLVAMLLGGGACAIAAAVVTLAPDVSTLPVREVVETVSVPPPVQDAPAAPELVHYNLYRSDVSRANDTVEALLRRLGLDDPAGADALRRDALIQSNLLGRTGRQLSVVASEKQTLLKLTARWSPDDDGNFKRLIFEKTATGYASHIETAPLTASLRIASATIESSLFASADEAGIPDAVAIQIAEIFSGDIDFHRELRKGDRYAVVYEVLEGDGEPLRAGRVLSTEFTNNGKTFQALWFQEPAAGQSEVAQDSDRPTRSGGRSGYYTPEGNSLKRAYLASPLAFSRVTSGFKMRLHPILQTWRAHTGVDYAAPLGTPVRATGDGVVDFAGVQGGYGNVVFIRHRNNQVTVYAHLSRIFVQRGQRVEQGQNIAATGATGWATGPHLHYEFRVNGQFQNPLTIARNSESVPVSPAARPAFSKVAAQARKQLASARLLASR